MVAEDEEDDRDVERSDEEVEEEEGDEPRRLLQSKNIHITTTTRRFRAAFPRQDGKYVPTPSVLVGVGAGAAAVLIFTKPPGNPRSGRSFRRTD